MKQRAGEMTPMVKGLSYKHQGLSLISSTHVKKKKNPGMVLLTYKSEAWEVEPDPWGLLTKLF